VVLEEAVVVSVTEEEEVLEVFHSNKVVLVEAEEVQ
jgi:hypothetical protein